MLHGASEKVASSPAAGWLRAPLAHLPKDGGDIDGGKPLARPVYRPDVYARMVWRGAGDSRSAGLRLGRVGQRHSMHALMRGWFGGGRGIRGLPVCAWAELGSVIQCMRLSADGLVGGGGAQDGSLAPGWGWGSENRCLGGDRADGSGETRTRAMPRRMRSAPFRPPSSGEHREPIAPSAVAAKSMPAEEGESGFSCRHKNRTAVGKRCGGKNRTRRGRQNDERAAGGKKAAGLALASPARGGATALYSPAESTSSRGSAAKRWRACQRRPRRAR